MYGVCCALLEEFEMSAPHQSHSISCNYALSYLMLLKIISRQHFANLGDEHAIGWLPQQRQHGIPGLQLLRQAIQQLQALLVQQGLLPGLPWGKGQIEDN